MVDFTISGCGNGRYLHINEDIFKLGCDVCRPLVEAARCKGHEVQVCDGLRLPFREGCFDAILSISGTIISAIRDFGGAHGGSVWLSGHRLSACDKTIAGFSSASTKYSRQWALEQDL